jgi:MYXO-CTERM domain-containing protein
VALVFAALAQGATNFSFLGTFAADDQVQLFDFAISTDSIVTLQSWGYGGGTNAAGTTIPAGGFDSFFTWYAADGTLIGTDDQSCGSAGSNNGVCLDAYAQISLSAGSYVLALTEYWDLPNGSLADGFSQQGAGDFTASGACGAFCDVFGNTDNGNWAVDILSVDSASEQTATPEPGTLLVGAGGLFVLALARRRRNT